MNIGIVGLDSSHAVMFARFFNEREAGRLGRVVVAWPGGSSDVALSAGRVAEFTRQVRDDFGVKIVTSISEVASSCEAVLLLSMDGRTHATQFAEICKGSARRVYINKPLAASSADARAIAISAERAGVRWFSASMLRFVGGLNGKARSATASCPLWWDDGANAGWFWYGMHGVELIYAAMGAGVARVSVQVEAASEVLTVHWRDGRTGVVRGILNKEAPFSLAFDDEAAREIALPSEAFELATARFLAGSASSLPPVANDETIEIMRCVEAANESRAHGGRVIVL